MHSNQKLIQHLGQIVNLQLNTSDQFYLHARLYKKWGLSALAELTRDKSAELIAQTEQLAAHIEQLGATVDNLEAENMLTGTSVLLCLQFDHKASAQCQTSYQQAIALCSHNSDKATAKLLRHFIHQFEAHSEWLTNELKFIQTRGIEAFIKNEMGVHQFWKLAAS